MAYGYQPGYIPISLPIMNYNCAYNCFEIQLLSLIVGMNFKKIYQGMAKEPPVICWFFAKNQVSRPKQLSLNKVKITVMQGIRFLENTIKIRS